MISWHGTIYVTRVQLAHTQNLFVPKRLDEECIAKGTAPLKMQ